jgi:hypothetical protein
MGFGSAVAGRIGVRKERGARLERDRGALRIQRFAVGTAMFVCAFALWTVAPAVVFWLVPRLSGSGSALLDKGSLAPLLAVVGALALVVLLGQGLARLNGVYCRLIEREFHPGLDAAWRRPLCNAEEGKRETGLLEVVMVSSVLTAGVAFVIWFFFIAQCTAAGC